ncbi:immunoglobulin-like domain-containing protein [Mucilaginibacter sp. OK268]|uniref:immunoglobulin-like domain-containing protein n=1 Tax=Mucilaginibacter sp. OK268 TaxID=1881048 RepID=UPI000B841697|nr:immunoglobulin-like domain-containing protein [Mucilaginibacter sp. OK268]
MKRYINYLVMLAIPVMLLLTACNKDNFNYKSGYVGSSKITTYPTITVTGDDYLIVKTGAAFTDPGATAKAGTADIKVVATSISTSTPGVYTITYTATNVDGFSATASRHVIVYTTDASAQANDFSGTYARTSNGQIATWTKLAPGVYSVLNPGGAVGATLSVIVFNNTGNKVFIPQQSANDGSPTSSAQESSTAGPGGTLAQYSMVIVNPGYGAAVRTFVKQ